MPTMWEVVEDIGKISKQKQRERESEKWPQTTQDIIDEYNRLAVDNFCYDITNYAQHPNECSNIW